MTFAELEDALARIKAIANEDEQRDAVFALEAKLDLRDGVMTMDRLKLGAAKIGVSIRTGR